MTDFAFHLDDDVSLVAPHPRYAPDVFRMINDDRERMRRWFSWVDDINGEMPIRSHYAERCQQLAKGTGGAWLIREAGRIVGHIGITPKFEGHAGEIEYWFGSPPPSGKGIMTRCATRVIEHGHAAGLRRVEVRCSHLNDRSRRVIERLPVQYEATLKNGDPLPDGTISDHHVWSSVVEQTPREAEPIRLTLATEHPDLQLVLPQKLDASEMFSIIDSDRDRLGHWLLFVDRTHAPADVEAWFRLVWQGFCSGSGVGVLMIAKGQVVGSVGVVGVTPANKCGEIGFWIHRDFEGRGYITAAVKAVEQWAWQHLDLVRLQLRIEDGNDRSMAVAERCGFSREGLLRSEDIHRGRPGNLVVFGKTPAATASASV